MEKLSELDVELLVFLNGLGSESYDSFWRIATNTIYWIPVFLIVFILLLKTSSKKEILLTLSSILLLALSTGLVVFLFKENVMRLRPNNDETVSQMLRLVIRPVSYSFISGHAANSIAVTSFVVMVFREKTKWIYLFWLWPMLFIYSRLYFGVHYPSDIISGVVIGFLLSFAFYRFHNFLGVKFRIY
ncbi:phosphatase PAP2 family protein [Sungkyunkwania multivorans]|uniref:Phosphatase PAP2 family protein n=1 Tax=Sungkyunkwania multivorans TaxID=1173618 RepID=A0ABW3CYR7_9FLAO